jgi:YD repeat-containing protein
VTDFKYDRNGNLTEIKKGKSITRFEYDAVNRLNAVITPAGQRLTYSYKPGERSLIEQHQHAAVLVADLRDTGLTFASQLQVTATRPVTGLIGSARFSETLGTFQLSGSDGTEVVRPQERFQAALKKLFLYDSSASARELRSGFNIPFNTMFMPAEYVTINCCPECYDDSGEWYCPPCFPPPPPPCPDGVSISTVTQMSLADNYPVIRTGIGILAGMQVTPVSTDWSGTQIVESVTPGAINTCPASFGSCSGSSVFTVGEGGGDWGVTLPPQQNIFVDEHSQTDPTSLLDVAGINSCQRTCAQVYTCNGTPIGSFTINRTFTKGLIQGDHVTVVTVTKQ